MRIMSPIIQVSFLVVQVTDAGLSKMGGGQTLKLWDDVQAIVRGNINLKLL